MSHVLVAVAINVVSAALIAIITAAVRRFLAPAL
ncbi:hypothetical protein GA0070613_5869 [Micromonospora inositola]|uniref:Uncharacterized protein n=1 Tax=Micromonospora inositola TaxID=47865 RepID=A0A1C5JZX6_9ACTN|nr:hypothetical protein GA0070613_5869 [Micromonospora inositola]